MTMAPLSEPIIDGVDTLRGIERLQFADQSIVLDGLNNEPVGLLDIDAGLVDLDSDTADPADDTAPLEDQLLTVNIDAVTDADNVSSQSPAPSLGPSPTSGSPKSVLDEGVFEDIVIATGLGDVRATGTTFTPGDAEAGLRLRVRAVYQDANGVLETVFSAPTAAVAHVNDAPGGSLTISDTTPTETQQLSALNAITDVDGLTGAVFTYQWQQANVTGVGGGGPGGINFEDIPGATLPTFTPTQAQVDRELRVVVTYTDDQGTTETVSSAATTVVGDFVPATPRTNAHRQRGPRPDPGWWRRRYHLRPCRQRYARWRRRWRRAERRRRQRRPQRRRRDRHPQRRGRQ